MVPPKHILSKSTFMYGCQCPKRLYLHKFRGELRNPEDEEQASIFAAGTDIGLLAQGLFPGGVNAEPPDPFSYHLSVAKTQKFIAEGKEIIYEAAFNFEGVLCAMDILVKQKGKWYAYEVKGSSKVKDTFVRDAALQYYVITQAGIELEDIFIVHLDTSYVRNGDLELSKLFKKESIKAMVLAEQDFISTKIEELKKVISDKKEPEIEVGDHCFAPYECDFSAHCWSNVEEEDEAENKIKKFINKEAVRDFLFELEYPLHFFDFETFMPAIPEFDNSRPFQQLPFLYSIHTLKQEKAALKHFDWMGDGNTDPRPTMVKQLVEHLGTKGSILVWNQSFEITRMRELARDFPQYEKQLLKAINRVVDLMVPFKKKHIVLPACLGSASLKRVSPVLVPEHRYDALEVQDGGTASALYTSLKQFEENEVLTHSQNLRAYCHQDTLVMVKILEKMKGFVK